MGRRRVAIIGGGLTGLSAAYRLHADGGDRVLVRVFERSGEPGGRVGTVVKDGFLLERGPDTFLARKPEAAALADELGLDTELISTNPAHRGSFVLRDGRLMRVPEGMSGLVPGRLGPLLRSELLSWPGRMRAAAEPMVPPRHGTGEETVAEFATRRFGAEVYRRLLEPLLCGIYAGDGERLSAAATVPQLVALEREHGSILRGIRRGSRADRTTATGFLSFRSGMASLVQALRRRLNGTLACGSGVDALTRRADGWVVRAGGGSEEWDAVVLAGPAWIGADLLGGVDPDLAAALARIEFASVAAAWFGFAAGDVPEAPQGYGYVIPQTERRAALACSWSDQKLEGRAPPGARLYRVFVGRAGQPIDTWSDDDLRETARSELADTLGITARPQVAEIVRHERSMPQYTVGHGSRIDDIRRRVSDHPGLHVAGNWMDGVGISDCIRSGQAAARAILERESTATVGR